MKTIPDISIPVGPGTLTWTQNGVWETGHLTISDENGFVRLGAVSRRLHRNMKCGFRISAKEMDELCRRWLAERES